MIKQNYHIIIGRKQTTENSQEKAQETDPFLTHSGIKTLNWNPLYKCKGTGADQ